MEKIKIGGFKVVNIIIFVLIITLLCRAIIINHFVLFTYFASLLLLLLYFHNKQYIFYNNKLIIKYPFLKGKTYDFNNLIDYIHKSIPMLSLALSSDRFYQMIPWKKNYAGAIHPGSITFFPQGVILIFNNEGRVNIPTFVAKNIHVTNFINGKYNFIKQKIFDEIINSGFEYKDPQQNIIFKKDTMEIIENNMIQKSYFYDRDVKNIRMLEGPEYRSIYWGTIRFEILLTDGKTIKLYDDYLNGGIGLFAYLGEKCPKGSLYCQC